MLQQNSSIKCHWEIKIPCWKILPFSLVLSSDSRLPPLTCNVTDGVHGPGSPTQFASVLSTSSNLGPRFWYAIKHLTDDVRCSGPPFWSWMAVLWSACQITACQPPDPWPPPVVTLCCLIILLKCWTMAY